MKYIIFLFILFGCSKNIKDETKVGIILSEQYLSKKIFDTNGKVLFSYEKPMHNDTIWVDWYFGDTAITETARKLSSATTETKRAKFFIANMSKI